MIDWDEYAFKLRNDKDSGVYEDFFERTGYEEIIHHGLIPFGDPKSLEFKEKIQLHHHIYSVGDNLCKIAHKYYGDARLWWILAWYNTKPTDFHCKIGDTIKIPVPLEEVQEQIFNVVVL